MSNRVLDQVRNQWAGFLALFLVLAGGTAYAANTIGTSDVIDNSLLSADLKDNAAVATGDVINDTASGGGLRAGDLSPGSVGASEVRDNSLTGGDVVESTLAQVPKALNAVKLGGKSVSQLAAGRIHDVGGTGGVQQGLLPGLNYESFCFPGALFVGFRTGVAGTANDMSVTSGIETPTTYPSAFNLASGAANAGFAYSDGDRVGVSIGNSNGDAAAESQLIIDAGARTYSVALHMYHRASDGFCEATGTATVAE